MIWKHLTCGRKIEIQLHLAIKSNCTPFSLSTAIHSSLSPDDDVSEFVGGKGMLKQLVSVANMCFKIDSPIIE